MMMAHVPAAHSRRHTRGSKARPEARPQLASLVSWRSGLARLRAGWLRECRERQHQQQAGAKQDSLHHVLLVIAAAVRRRRRLRRAG
jgi:hypothetical protein